MPKRPLFVLLALIVFRASAPADDATRCKVYGPIFGVDPLGGTLLVKDPGGYLKTVNLPPATAVSTPGDEGRKHNYD